MQSEKYEVQNEELHGILHFVFFTLHFALLHPLVAALPRQVCTTFQRAERWRLRWVQFQHRCRRVSLFEHLIGALRIHLAAARRDLIRDVP